MSNPTESELKLLIAEIYGSNNPIESEIIKAFKDNDTHFIEAFVAAIKIWKRNIKVALEISEKITKQ
jgi:hypothetical protein